MSVHEKIVRVMDELKAIAKDKQNKQQGFNYRGIDDLYNHLHGLFAKHKMFTVPVKMETIERQERQFRNGTGTSTVIEITYRIIDAEDGSHIDAIARGEGMDTGDKGTSKALSMAHKYLLIQLFVAPTKDMVDGDSESVETLPEAGYPVGQPHNTPKTYRVEASPAQPDTGPIEPFYFKQIMNLADAKEKATILKRSGVDEITKLTNEQGKKAVEWLLGRRREGEGSATGQTQ